MTEMSIKLCQRVAGVLVGWARLTGRGRAVAEQHTGQPPVGAEHLGGLLVAGTARKAHRRFRFGEVAVQWCAVQQAWHRRRVDVAGHGQVAPCDQSLPGPLTLTGTVFDWLCPAIKDSERPARL